MEDWFSNKFKASNVFWIALPKQPFCFDMIFGSKLRYSCFPDAGPVTRYWNHLGWGLLLFFKYQFSGDFDSPNLKWGGCTSSWGTTAFDNTRIPENKEASVV